MNLSTADEVIFGFNQTDYEVSDNTALYIALQHELGCAEITPNILGLMPVLKMADAGLWRRWMN